MTLKSLSSTMSAYRAEAVNSVNINYGDILTAIEEI